MPYEIAADREAQILRVRYTGEITLAERLVIAREAVRLVRSSGIHRVLLDFRAAQSLGFDQAARAGIVDECMPQLPPEGRVAYLVRYEHQVDDALEVLARSRGFHVERFHDKDVATAWLQETGPRNRWNSVESDGPHALRLAGELADPGNPLAADQIVALGDMVHALVAAGMEDSTVRRVAGRIASVMRPTHRGLGAGSQSPPGPASH